MSSQTAIDHLDTAIVELLEAQLFLDGNLTREIDSIVSFVQSVQAAAKRQIELKNLAYERTMYDGTICRVFGPVTSHNAFLSDEAVSSTDNKGLSEHD